MQHARLQNMPGDVLKEGQGQAGSRKLQLFGVSQRLPNEGAQLVHDKNAHEIYPIRM